MTDRIAFGNVFGDGSMYGGRVSIPGYDALTEPFNSDNVPFDTRYTMLGTVVKAGLINCGAGPVPFDDLGYEPIAAIFPYFSGRLGNYNVRSFGGSVPHYWIPAVAIVTSSSIEVVPFQLGQFYNAQAFYNPVGQPFQFYVFNTDGLGVS
ncbi:hypothetical protein [Afipia carboxidovorans]|uniref:hypothetical protein n=1 Tax=Afipia carboxidovorans TaxID=40137 RepID=UPI0030876EEB|nr:hypothetical protein CRBSH125_00930 [Afipia carboxidovorans]